MKTFDLIVALCAAISVVCPNVTAVCVADPNLLWPGGIVVFRLQDISCPYSFECDLLMEAMEHFHTISCIRFKEWTGEKNYVNIFYNFEKPQACYSHEGRRVAGKQRLSLGQSCWSFGVIVHELGHSVGFRHEMNRPDRDDYIHVYWDNIDPEQIRVFEKHDSSEVETFGEEFDYTSIMMYDEHAFSKDGVSPTLASITGTPILPHWMKPGLSASDLRRLFQLYQCDGNEPLSRYPYDINCRFDRNTCGFQNGTRSNWQLFKTGERSGHIYCSPKNVGSTPSQLVSAVIPELPTREDSPGNRGCARFHYYLYGQGEATLKVAQAYLPSLTNVKFERAHPFAVWNLPPTENNWQHINLPIYVTKPFRLIFTAEFDGTDENSLVALDDIQILYRPCETLTGSSSSSYPSEDQETRKNKNKKKECSVM